MRTIRSGDTVIDGAEADAATARLWLLPPATEAESDACARILSAGERDRAARFVFDRDRRLYLTAHAAVRHALSSVRPERSPADWAFGRADGGRPFAVGSGPWDFNLSHTRGLVACLVAGPGCGVDVEAVSVRVASLGSAVFAPAELDLLRSAGAGEAELATSLWTLKEAYAKARGLGLRLPFARCRFEVRGSSAVLAARPDRDRGRYRFHRLRVRGHVVSVALGGPAADGPLAVRSGRPDWADPAAWFGAGPGSAAAPGPPARPQSEANP